MVVVEKGGINKNFKESLTELLKIKQINFVFDVGRILKRFSLFFYELNFILIYFFKELNNSKLTYLKLNYYVQHINSKITKYVSKDTIL